MRIQFIGNKGSNIQTEENISAENCVMIMFRLPWSQIEMQIFGLGDVASMNATKFSEHQQLYCIGDGPWVGGFGVCLQFSRELLFTW